MTRFRLLALGLVLAATGLGACAGGGGVPDRPIATLSPSERLEMGHALFSARCQSCHALPNPKQLRPEQWPAEVAGMSRKSGLDGERMAVVSEYLVAASGGVSDGGSRVAPGGPIAPLAAYKR